MKSFSTPLFLAWLISTPLSAQSTGWGITPEIGFSWFGGSAREDSAGMTAYFHPSSSRSGSLRIDYSSLRFALAVTVLYERTGVQETGDDLAVTVHDIVKLYSLQPELSVRVLRLGSAAVHSHAGIAITRWHLAGEDARSRIGVLGGLTVEAPFSRSIALRLRWEGTLSPSVFEDSDLPASFELRNTFHSRLGLGIRLGL